MIKIKRNTNGDSRVADHIPTISEFEVANASHVEDVRNLISQFCEDLKFSSNNHDWSKLKEPYKSMFYRDLCNTISDKISFEDSEWHTLHCTKLERHHLKRYVPDDVNLFDVIEMLCDCVAAGMARSYDRDLKDLDIDPEILQRAVRNTVEYLKDQVEVIDNE